MKRIDEMIKNKKYQECLLAIQEQEKGRKFCSHTIEHFLAVARLMYISTLEEGLEIDKEVLYATALLHDIGRHLQYTQGIPHEEASSRIAMEILGQCGFSLEEKNQIIEAISSHRTSGKDGLSGLLYKMDKLSRNCFMCEAINECNWPNEKKNKCIGD